ncbi:hypothetical protein D9758_006495 [Tetrapyrgos nigripes]|uniref:Abscisic acid G-protein coupled receptor-domain-containing protein n=1 Tax=Tetrapyrgos nigripes TaxID=182062 RepID=A0A8H5LRE2_9AGAR|nr:hypothetical protein D9758_006495 [Tetrapyrgos nigripes]
MAVLVESSILLGLRFVLFFSCRKYLLRSLYSDLQHLSVEAQSDHSSSAPSPPSEDVDEIQLGSIGSLPTPSTHSKSNRKGLGRILGFGIAGKRAKHPTHSSISRAVFAMCFSESCMLFVLLICQALGVFDTGTRLYNWNFSLFLLLTALLVLIPLLLSLVLVVASSSLPSVPSTLPTTTPSATPNRGGIRTLTPIRAVITLIPVLLYLGALSRIPLPPGLAAAGSHISFLTASLARLVFVGTIILGILSGIGAVNNSWKWVPLNRDEVEVTDRTIETAERALERVRDDLRQKREEAKRRAGNDSSDASASWYARMVPNLRGGDDYAQEMKGLEALEYQMTLNLEDLVMRRAEARFGHTVRGKLWNFGGRIFALYCAIRVLSSIVNILIPRSLFTRPSQESSSTGINYPDLITKFLADVLSLVSANVDLDELARIARQVSLVLVGAIVLSSIRMVLRGVGRVLRVTSKNLGASLMLLILAQLMGIYLLSTIVQMRNLFPPTLPFVPNGSNSSSSNPNAPETETNSNPDINGQCGPDSGNCQGAETNLFSTIPPFEVFGRLFDWSFLCAAVVTASVLWFRRRLRD